MERNLLATCGLNETEQSVLLYLLEYGRTGAASIAKRTGIKRPTVYSCLANLESLGLIGRHVTRGSTQFAAIEPDAIPGVFISKAKNEFQRVTQAALQLEGELKQYKVEPRRRIGGYEISTLESTQAMFAFLENVLTKGGYRGIFNPQSAFKGRGREVAEHCLRVTARTKPYIREIAVEGPLCDWWVSNIRNQNHLVRTVSMDQTLLTDILLYEETVVLTNYDPDHEMSVLIKHPDYYRMMVAVFDAFWNSLKEAKEKSKKS